MKNVYRYYCLFRPPMPGTIPRGMVNIADYGERRTVPEIQREAWGHADYERKLTEREMYEYELAEGGPV